MPHETLLGITRALGSGTIRAITGTDPPAGSLFIETVPPGIYWRLISVAATLVTDATAASRIVQLGMIGGVGLPYFFASASNNNQPANITSRYYWSATGLPISTTFKAAATFDVHLAMLNDVILGPGFQFFSAVGVFQPGDDWGPPTFLVEQWPE